MVKLEIDKDTCIRCGQCVFVCPVRILTQTEDKGEIGVINLQTCLECTQCVSICPTDSVHHSSFSKVYNVKKEILPSAESLLELMHKRRSNRAFSQKPIPMEYLDMILEAANLAPTAKNKRPLRYTLITNPLILQAVHKACIDVCNNLYIQFSKSEDVEIRKKGLYFQRLSLVYKNGYEIILRGATALILIHCEDIEFTPDANLSYQNASLMAETLDVAHFYTGYLRRLSMMDTEDIIRNAIGLKGQYILAGMALAMPKYTFSKYVKKEDLKVTKLL